MTHTRKFDYDKAKRMRKNGHTYAQIAQTLNVSTTAIRRAVDPNTKNRMNLRLTIWQRSGTCIDCGCQCSFNSTDLRAGRRNGRCKECAGIHAATSVRDDSLRCRVCRQWLPDTAYPHDRLKPARRGRHKDCTACQTRYRRERRALGHP